ncbi:MAG: hypothetical protein HUJ25_14280 [Crocinitomicaceae bacterium]|nr:hypothetical protein [Crocinitomicaceae bacterium]
MTDITISLDQLIYGNQAPWKEANAIDEKFASEIHKIQQKTPSFEYKYVVNFERPFNHKTKYYAKLITNETIATITQFHDIISADDNEKIKAYWLDKLLEKKLKTRLSDIGKIIKEKDYSLSYINPKQTSIELDEIHKSDTYVMQLLKVSLMHLYLELQEAFKESISDTLIINDFYTQLLREPIPDTAYISEIKIIEIEPQQEQISTPQPSPVEITLQSFIYKQLATNSDKLADLHDSLKKNNFIAQDTTLTNFKKVFSGKEISTPVHWTGNISEFYYFIKLIYTEHELVENLKQKQWEVACKCFVQSDGSAFERSKLRSLKRPSATGDILDKAVELIK